MTESSLPSNVGIGTVIGKFVTAQKGVSGAPVTVPIVGSVIFTPTPSRLLDANATPPVTILPQPVTIALDAAGAFTVDLVATDDADLNPTGWNYRVSFNLTGLKADPFNINVPQGTTVDLALVAPVASANGTYITRGIGVPDTTGVTAGDVVTWNGTAIAWATPTGGGGGATTLDGLTDVNTSGVTDGQALVYDTGTASWSVGSVPSTPADIGAATAAQGALADSAVQPGDLAAVATSGAYGDIIGRPTTAADLGAVPTTRLVAGHALSADVTLAKADVGLGSVDNTADTAKNVLSASKLTTARTINGVSFDGTVNITVADATKVPTTTTVNGHALSANVTVTAGDVGATPYALAAGASAIRMIGSGTTLPGTATAGDVFILTA